MKVLYFGILLLLTGLVSCESNKLISVKIIDKETKLPIDSVFVEVNAGKDGDYTKSRTSGYSNASGEFKTQLMIGCADGCYDIQMIYSKRSYHQKTELNNTEGIIVLER